MDSAQTRVKREFDVRLLRGEDFAQIFRLAANAAEGDNNWPIEHLTAELRGVPKKAADPARVVFGAFAGESLAGVACATPRKDGIGFISRIYVASEERGAGLARALVAAAEEFLAAEGFEVVQLAFWGTSRAGQRVWVKMGYRRTGTRLYRDDYTTGLVVVSRKRLSG